MTSSNVAAVQALEEGFNNRDWDVPREIIADECVFVDGMGQRHEGPDGYVNEYSKPWADAFSDGKVTDQRFHDAGDTVVVEFVGRGTNDGPLGPMPATGKYVELSYCEIYEFNTEGKVVSGRAYFNQMSLMAQLGHAEVPAMAGD